MDPIKSMMSGADPLNRDASEVPDGEAALRRMFAEPAAFSDSRPSNVASLEEVRRHRRARLAGLAGIAAAAVTVGVLVATNLGSLTTAPVPAGTGAPTAMAAAPATSTATPTAASVPAIWSTFTDATGQATFELPESWTVSEAPKTMEGGSYNTVVVRNAGGKTVSTLSLAYDGAGDRYARIPGRPPPSIRLSSIFRRRRPNSGNFPADRPPSSSASSKEPGPTVPWP